MTHQEQFREWLENEHLRGRIRIHSNTIEVIAAKAAEIFGQGEGAGEVDELWKALEPHVDRREGRMGGAPCLQGHRITFTQLLAEAADCGSIDAVSDNFDLEPNKLRLAIRALADYLYRKVEGIDEPLREPCPEANPRR